MTPPRAAGRLAGPLVAAGAAIAVSAGVLLAAGIAPLPALAALAAGAGGDRFALTDTLLKSCPLALTGLAVTVAFRSGLWNIGAEGQLLVGALAAATVGGSWALPAPLALAAGAIAGALWAAIAAALRVTRHVNEVITTIMLNFVALRLVGWAVHGPLQEGARRYPQSDALAPDAMLPALVGRVHGGVALAAVLLVVVWALLFRTPLGLRWRAAGDNPRAAALAGFPPARDVLAAMATSGALAGLAGAIEITGVTGRLFEQFSGGQGYTAIAVALLARLSPLGVGLAALAFGALAAGSGAMQRVAGVPSVFVAVVQATALLALLAHDALRTAPASAPAEADP